MAAPPVSYTHLHQVQARVDASGGAGAGDHGLVVDVQHGRVDPRCRERARQLPGIPPVSGAAPPVEQPGGTEDERPGAHAEHPRAALHAVAQRGKQRFRDCLLYTSRCV